MKSENLYYWKIDMYQQIMHAPTRLGPSQVISELCSLIYVVSTKPSLKVNGLQMTMKFMISNRIPPNDKKASSN